MTNRIQSQQDADKLGLVATDGHKYLELRRDMKAIKESVADEAAHMERDHEVQMARSDLYKIANYAVKLHKMLKNVSEEEGIQGWMQAKITKAADYMSSVAHTLEYDMMEKHQSEPMPAAENVEETTSAGGVAAVATPMGKTKKKK